MNSGKYILCLEECQNMYFKNKRLFKYFILTKFVKKVMAYHQIKLLRKDILIHILEENDGFTVLNLTGKYSLVGLIKGDFFY